MSDSFAVFCETLNAIVRERSAPLRVTRLQTLLTQATRDPTRSAERLTALLQLLTPYASTTVRKSKPTPRNMAVIWHDLIVRSLSKLKPAYRSQHTPQTLAPALNDIMQWPAGSAEHSISTIVRNADDQPEGVLIADVSQVIARACPYIPHARTTPDTPLESVVNTECKLTMQQVGPTHAHACSTTRPF